VHEAITAILDEFATTPRDPRRLEGLLHRIASMQGRLNYAETAVRAAWELSLGESGMSSQHIADLKAQMKLAVGR
jgi:hypothetical protein